MRTEQHPDIVPEYVRLLEANGGCASELALQRYAMEASEALFRDSLRRLWKFISDLDRFIGKGE